MEIPSGCYPHRYVSIGDITRLDTPHQHSDADIARLRFSIETHGFLGAVILSDDLTVIDGDARIEAAELCGMSHVPAHIVPKIGVQRLLAHLATNAPFARWNTDEVRQWVHVLADQGCDLDETAWKPHSLERIIAPPEKKQPRACPSCGAAV